MALRSCSLLWTTSCSLSVLSDAKRDIFSGVAAITPALTVVTPNARSVRAADSRVEPLVSTSSTTRTEPPCSISWWARDGTTLKDGKARRRSARERPVCGCSLPGQRSNIGRAGRPSRAATARASSSAWSNPRWERRALVVGGHVTTLGAMHSDLSWSVIRTLSARASASQLSATRRSRYFKRATTSRSAPSYTKGAAIQSTPDGGSRKRGACALLAHCPHSPSAGAPHPAHAAGKTACSTVAKTPM